MSLVVPPAIENVIVKFEQSETPVREIEVQSELKKVRGQLSSPTSEENLGAWAEALAFALVPSSRGDSDWGTYFGPMASGTNQEGKTVYFPDIEDTGAEVVDHWSYRATTIKNPVMKARYADLAWDMCLALGKERRERKMADIAIDAYLESSQRKFRSEMGDQFRATIRALDLAITVRDNERIDNAKKQLLSLHRAAVAANHRAWWMAFDRLMADKNVNLTNREKAELVSSLEELLVQFADQSRPETFNPHDVKSISRRLVPHYRRAQKPNEAKRLHEQTARAFEHAATLGSAMVASSFLQTAVNEYHSAGLRDEGARARILMQQKIEQSRDEMGSFETAIEVSRDDMKAFLDNVLQDDIGGTFARLASQFLPNKKEIEQQLIEGAKDAPLQAMISFQIMDGNQVVATIGSLEEDLPGRLIYQTSMNFGLSDLWLWRALEGAIEAHSIQPGHIVSWANRLNLFDDVSLLIEGVEAWHAGDTVKAIHILVPQVETGLRGIVHQLGKPTTKRHPTLAGVSVAVGMGDIVYAGEVAEALGPDLTLYFSSLFADPRGRNLRNTLAHGKLSLAEANEATARWVIHSLLVLGVWKELAEHRR